MYKLGIDLGGTNIVAGVVDKKYKIVAKASCKTAVPRPESEICDSMAEVAKKAVEKAKLTMDDIESVGIGVPGAVNPKTGGSRRVPCRKCKGCKKRSCNHSRHRRRRRNHH